MNEQTARAKCLQADRLLEKARAAGSDKTLILKAMSLYQEVVEQAEPLAEPYLGLAYLAFSAGQKSDALALLHQAQSIEPAHLRVLTLLHRIEKSRPQAALAAQPAALSPIRSLRQQVETAVDPAWSLISFDEDDEDYDEDEYDDEEG